MRLLLSMLSCQCVYTVAMVQGRWEEQDEYIEWLQAAKGMEEVEKLQETASKLTLQVQEATRRENVLNMRLATKQQELQDTLVSNNVHCESLCI